MAMKARDPFPHQAKCSGIRVDGERCRSFASPETGFCWFHDPRPEVAMRRTAGRREASKYKRQKRLKALLPPRLVSVYEHLEKALIDAYEGRLPATRAAAMASVATAMVRVLEAGEIEQKVRELEQAAAGDDGDALVEESV